MKRRGRKDPLVDKIFFQHKFDFLSVSQKKELENTVAFSENKGVPKARRKKSPEWPAFSPQIDALAVLNLFVEPFFVNFRI